MAFAFQMPCKHFVDSTELTEGHCYLHPMNEAHFPRFSFHRRIRFVHCLFILSLIGFGCQTPHPHQAALDTLHDLEGSVTAAFHQVQNLPADSVIASARWAHQNLQEFELLLSDSRVQITKAEGSIISEVSRARRLLKDHESRRDRLTENTERTQLQLQLLREAIETNAQFDGKGTPIDSVYIEKQLQIENRVANELVTALLETVDLANRGVTIVAGARFPNDSLQQILRARLAQIILEDSNESPQEAS